MVVLKECGCSELLERVTEVRVVVGGGDEDVVREGVVGKGRVALLVVLYEGGSVRERLR